MRARITVYNFQWTLALGDDARAALGKSCGVRASRSRTCLARDARRAFTRWLARMTGTVIRARQELRAANEDAGAQDVRAPALTRRKY
jgi:hypothetical protein